MARDAIQLKLVVLEDEKAKIPRPTELEELYESLDEAMEGYIEVKLQNNMRIPLPNGGDM